MRENRTNTPIIKKILEIKACLSSSGVIGPKAAKKKSRGKMLEFNENDSWKKETQKNSRLI